jgi:hypothetical protein
MYNDVVNKILKEYNVTMPLGKVPLTQGPNIDFRGPQAAGFLGGGLPAINPSTSVKVKLKNKKSKKLKKRA